MLLLRVQVAWWHATDLWYQSRATVRRVSGRTISHVKQKARKSRRKARAMKEKVVERSKHSFYSSFPGISRVKLPRPPLPHLLRSNIPPTEREISLIRDAISVAEAEELRLEEELSRKAHRRSNLTVYKLERAFSFVREQKAILSLIRRIPPEILQEIFIHTLPSNSNSNGLRSTWYPIDNLPWALSQVSHLWRRTALETSILWRQLPTIFLTQEYTKEKRYLEFLDEMLLRSHDVPIDVHLYGPTFTDDAHPALDTLISHSPRWRRGKLEIPCISLVALEGIKGRLSSLQTLLIRSYESGAFVDSDVIIDTFEDAPCLRNVTLSGTYAAYFILPFSQLVDYAQEECHIKQMNNVTDLSSSSLQNLAILDFRQTNVHRPLITLPQLVVLKARFDFGTAHQNLLEFLILPTLEELSISSCSGQLISSVSSMISRTRSPSILKKLFLRTLFADGGGELTALLSKTPLISHLNVNLPSVEDLSSLIPVGGGQVVAPRLLICEFYIYAEAPLPDDTIQQLNRLASSRCELSDQSPEDFLLPTELHRLRTIYVHFDPRISEPQQRQFENWPATQIAQSLDESRKLLTDYIPELYFGRRSARKILDFKRKDKASFILSCVENLNVENAEEIYHSGIHYTLDRLSYWFLDKSPKHKLSQTAKRILQKWEPLFKASLKDLHWAMKDGTSLMYLSKSPALGSMKDPTKVIFGVEDCDIPPSDLPWPLYGYI